MKGLVANPGWMLWIVLALFQQAGALLSVQRAYMPLIGGPKWLKLHEAVVVSEPESSSGDSSLFFIDFVPVRPTDPRTALMLLMGNAVDAEVRVKRVPKQSEVLIRADVELDADSKLAVPLDVDAILEEIQGYDTALRVPGNTCTNFVDFVFSRCRASIAATQTQQPRRFRS